MKPKTEKKKLNEAKMTMEDRIVDLSEKFDRLAILMADVVDKVTDTEKDMEAIVDVLEEHQNAMGGMAIYLSKQNPAIRQRAFEMKKQGYSDKEFMGDLFAHVDTPMDQVKIPFGSPRVMLDDGKNNDSYYNQNGMMEVPDKDLPSFSQIKSHGSINPVKGVSDDDDAYLIPIVLSTDPDADDYEDIDDKDIPALIRSHQREMLAITDTVNSETFEQLEDPMVFYLPTACKTEEDIKKEEKIKEFLQVHGNGGVFYGLAIKDEAATAPADATDVAVPFVGYFDKSFPEPFVVPNPGFAPVEIPQVPCIIGNKTAATGIYVPFGVTNTGYHNAINLINEHCHRFKELED